MSEMHEVTAGDPQDVCSVRFSSRTEWDMEDTPYACALREARASGRRLLDLTGSNPTNCGIRMDEDAVIGPLRDVRSLAYHPDPRGLLSAREAVCGYYGEHKTQLDPSELLLTASTSESYSFLFRLLCDPGDEVLIAQPSYPLFDLLAVLDDVRLVPYRVFHDHGWWIDFAELERRIGPRTRAVIVVHPNNPTGHLTSAEERRKLEGICAARGIALIVDEVFLDYSLDVGSRPASFASGDHTALTFVLSGLSKICALPQMKAAWIAAFGPAHLRSEALARLEVIADTFLSVSTPVQLALPAWLACRNEMQARILERIRTNLAQLAGCSREHPDRLRVIAPDAGWTAVLSLPQCGGDRGCPERLIREKGIVLHPGAFYGMAEVNRAVVSLLTPPEVLAEALHIL